MCTKYEGGGQARYELIPDEARVVRQVFAWVGRDRLTIGEVCRRLTQAGEVTRTGKTVWDRSVVWGILKNPAYQGAAAFGKTRQEPLRPRLRTQRQPSRAAAPCRVHRAMSRRRTGSRSRSRRSSSPRSSRRSRNSCRRTSASARQSRRGALYLLQGLLQCQHCGYAFYGKRLSPSARKGKPRAYAYYRCLGTDALPLWRRAGLCRIRRYGRIWWTWRSGRKSVPCWRTRSGSRRNIGAACSRRRPPNARLW